MREWKDRKGRNENSMQKEEKMDIQKKEEESLNIRPLLAALRENWNHARHQENQRMYSLYIHSAITAGIISVLSFVVRWNSPLVIPLVIAALGFLAFFIIIIYYAVLKLNAEFSNHIAAVQWISEKLGLIKKMEEKKKLEKKLKKLKKIPEYAFFDEAYMGLPLPLSVRVHRTLELYYLIVIASSSTLAIVTAFSLLSYNILGIAVAAIIIFIIIFCIFWRERRRIEDERKIFKKFRKPEEIKIGESWRDN